MNKIMFFFNILFLGTYCSSLCMQDITHNLEQAVEENNYSLFKDQYDKYKQLRVKFLYNGETPLTLVIKNVTKNNSDFFIMILSFLNDVYMNKENKEKKLPLQLALERNLMNIAIELVKAGAQLTLINNRLLSRKMDGKILINELIASYIDDYCSILKSLKYDSFNPKFYSLSLGELINVYCSKCCLDSPKDRNRYRKERDKIGSLLGNRGIKKRRLLTAYNCFMMIFGSSKGESGYNCFEIKKTVDSEFDRFISKVEKNTDKKFCTSLVLKRVNKNFIDVKVKILLT